MDTKISNRINEVIRYVGLNVSSFSKAIGLSNNVTIGRIIKEERNPSFEIIVKILQTFGSINPEWLITGNGPMVKKDIKDKVIPDIGQTERIESMNVVLFKEVKKNQDLTEQLEECQEEIASLKAIIQANKK